VRFCEDHWKALQVELERRGLKGLVPDSGTAAALKMDDQLKKEEVTPENFDPLMGAHWGITANVMQTLSQANPQAGLYLMAGDVEEDPVEGYGTAYAGRTWPRCPLCYLNLAHEVSCTDPRCKLPKETGYDWMVERAAEDQLATARRLGLADEPS
jgi:hypothetical protein